LNRSLSSSIGFPENRPAPQRPHLAFWAGFDRGRRLTLSQAGQTMWNVSDLVQTPAHVYAPEDVDVASSKCRMPDPRWWIARGLVFTAPIAAWCEPESRSCKNSSLKPDQKRRRPIRAPAPSAGS
jgi:hypothetical protein